MTSDKSPIVEIVEDEEAYNDTLTSLTEVFSYSVKAPPCAIKQEVTNNKFLSDSIAMAAYGGGYEVDNWSESHFSDINQPSTVVVDPFKHYGILFDCKETFEINNFGIICTSSFNVHATVGGSEICVSANDHNIFNPFPSDSVDQQSSSSSADEQSMATQALLKTNYIYVWPTNCQIMIKLVVVSRGAMVTIRKQLNAITTLNVRGSGQIICISATTRFTTLKCLVSGSGLISSQGDIVAGLTADARDSGEISGFFVTTKAALFPRDKDTFIGIISDNNCIIQKKTGTLGKVSASRQAGGRGPIRVKRQCRLNR